VSKTEQSDETAAFFRMQLEELLEMTDKDVLDGDDPGTLSSENMSLLAKAKVEVGRQRMESAKAGVAMAKVISSSNAEIVDINLARAYLQNASNDSRFTLAARSLSDMSEEDILRLYHQAKLLEQSRSDRA